MPTKDQTVCAVCGVKAVLINRVLIRDKSALVQQVQQIASCPEHGKDVRSKGTVLESPKPVPVREDEGEKENEEGDGKEPEKKEGSPPIF